jgi:hypothetical protein
MVGFNKTGIDSDRLVIVLDGTLVLPKIVIRKTPVVVGLSIARVQPDRLIIVLDRTLVLPKISICNTPVVVGLSIARVETDRLIKMWDRLAVPPGVEEIRASIVRFNRGVTPRLRPALSGKRKTEYDR